MAFSMFTSLRPRGTRSLTQRMGWRADPRVPVRSGVSQKHAVNSCHRRRSLPIHHVLIILCLAAPPYPRIVLQLSSRRNVASSSSSTSFGGVILVVESMWCNLCGASYVVRSMWCNLCGRRRTPRSATPRSPSKGEPDSTPDRFFRDPANLLAL